MQSRRNQGSSDSQLQETEPNQPKMSYKDFIYVREKDKLN